MKSRFDIGFSPMDRLDRSINAIDALGWMLYHTLEAGDDHSDIADGIHTLMTSQCRELEETRHGLAADISALKEENGAISRKLATNAPVSGPTVSREATKAERAVRGDFARLQEEFITDQLAAGKSHEEIASGMLLTPDTVKRMVENLPDREIREVFDRQEGRTVLRVSAVADTAEIAQALNLKQATVDRVADMLRGSAKPNGKVSDEDAA